MDIVILVTAAFFAGVLNTIAGGGTFLTLPALVFIGVEPIMANATSAVVVFPGYLGGALGFRRELAAFDRQLLLRLIAVTFAGAAVGSGLLWASSAGAFALMVPFLLLVATLVFLFGSNIRDWASRKNIALSPYGLIGLFFVSIYGGYFNGGLGIILLALFSLWGMRDVHTMNGLKSGLSFALSAISVGVFTYAGLVQWHHAVLMMAAAIIGGYAGAPLARLLPGIVVRAIIGVIGFGMSGVFLWRLL